MSVPTLIGMTKARRLIVAAPTHTVSYQVWVPFWIYSATVFPLYLFLMQSSKNGRGQEGVIYIVHVFVFGNEDNWQI